MSRLNSPGTRLREVWSAGPFALPGVFSPLVAKMAEKMGFRAIYLSGGAFSAGLGVPDIGLISVAEFAEEVRRITSACSLPLFADADTGFGEALNVERTVRLYESAGAAGLHLEDQQMPKRCGHLSGKSLISQAEMVAKVKAAVAAKRDPNFVIVARTDARGVNGFEDAVSRAKAYLDAGADAIFPEAMKSAEEFERFAKEVPGVRLANMTEFGQGPLLSVSELGKLGYTMVLFPLTAFRSAMKAAETTLRAVLEQGRQKDRLDSMQTRAELYEALDYTGYEQRDLAYFGSKKTNT